MTPVVNATITNVKVATHGRMDAMNAVLVSSIAASTFNPQLEAWEPLIEPFDGIFKYGSVLLQFFKIHVSNISSVKLFLLSIRTRHLRGVVNYRYETDDTGGNPLAGTETRVRVAATSILNLNITAANMEAFTGTVVSWRRQMELEERAIKLKEVGVLEHMTIQIVVMYPWCLTILV